MVAPLVSIGIPVYNGARVLNNSIKSLLNQTYRNLEIIISDDNSTDASVRVISNFAFLDSRIKVFQQPINRGAAFNFRFVLDQASGSYFFWNAQDDIRYAQYVEKCIKVLRNSSSVYCHSRYIDKLSKCDQILFPDRQPIVRSVEEIANCSSVACMYLKAYKTGIGSTAFYGLFHTDVLKSTRLWENYIGSDINLFNAVLLKGKISYVPEILFEYRARPLVRDKKAHARFLNPGRQCFWRFPRIIYLFKNLQIITESRVSALVQVYLILAIIFYEFKRTAILSTMVLLSIILPSVYKKLDNRYSFSIQTLPSGHID